MAFEPFMKWGLNYMGPINPPTHYIGNQYILITTDYTTKKVEVKTLCNNTTNNIVNFFNENIIT
jgi:hypothetical protein